MSTKEQEIHQKGIYKPNKSDKWDETVVKTDHLIWVPSVIVAQSFVGVVKSGSISYEFVQSALPQGMADLLGAIIASKKYWKTIIARIGEAAMEFIEGVITMLLMAVGLIALTTLVGAIIGFFAGGVGAGAGAALGFKVGIFLVEWLGLALLLVWLGTKIVQVGEAFYKYISAAWNANGDPKKIDNAAFLFADAIGITIGFLLQGLLFVAMKKGLPKFTEWAGNSRFGRFINQTKFYKWIREQTNPPKAGEKPAGQDGAHSSTQPKPRTPGNTEIYGDTVKSVRDALPNNEKPGFDLWIEDMVANGKNPETALSKMPADKRVDIAGKNARRFGEPYQRELDLYKAGKDNALEPNLPNKEKVADGVEIWYNKKKPDQNTEIDFAKRIHKETGEPIRVFGDTMSGKEYPGIDGTIGTKPRPLSLKTSGSSANANHVRWSAEQALVKMKKHGYTEGEVHIRADGKTIAQVQAGWHQTGGHNNTKAPVFEGNIVSKIVVYCSDGVWTIYPKSSPNVPPVLNEDETVQKKASTLVGTN